MCRRENIFTGYGQPIWMVWSEKNTYYSDSSALVENLVGIYFIWTSFISSRICFSSRAKATGYPK
jgi:hypothetical protein